MAKVVIHRDYPGEHDTDNPNCWCVPILIDDDDPRSGEEIAEEAKPRPS